VPGLAFLESPHLRGFIELDAWEREESHASVRKFSQTSELESVVIMTTSTIRKIVRAERSRAVVAGTAAGRSGRREVHRHDRLADLSTGPAASDRVTARTVHTGFHMCRVAEIRPVRTGRFRRSDESSLLVAYVTRRHCHRCRRCVALKTRRVST
jgi:hypothetical protein